MKHISTPLQYLALVQISKFFAQADESAAFNTTLDEIASEDAVDPKKFGNIIDMAYNKLEDHPEFLTLYSEKRSKRKIFHQMISHYGCHCFPGTGTEKGANSGGKGVPVDELDEACRTLYRCHKCISIEFNEPGNTCDTEFGSYKYSISKEMDSNGDWTQNAKIACTNPAKRPDCKLHQCQCDKQFSDTVYNLWTESTWEFNSKYWRNKRFLLTLEKPKFAKLDPDFELFDKDLTCLLSGTNNTPDACCGANYPEKTPYFSAEKKCCSAANKAYNIVTEICCEDTGEVRGAGRQCV